MDNNKLIKRYLVTQIIDPNFDWTKINWIQKLSYLQKTPDRVVKTRTIQNKSIPYVEIDYVERALNFISNFDWWYEIVDKWVDTYMENTSKWEKEVYDARVQLKCYVVIDWKKIEKWSFWAWKSYKNIATSKFDVYKSAESNAIKNFALTIWIWSDKKRSENQAINKFRDENYNEEEIVKWFISTN